MAILSASDQNWEDGGEMRVGDKEDDEGRQLATNI